VGDFREGGPVVKIASNSGDRLGLTAEPPLSLTTSRLPAPSLASETQEAKVREKFNEFVAGTFYRTLLTEMRKSLHPEKALMYGGRAEEIFRAQLDQTLAERLAASHGESFSGKLYEQFSRNRHANAAESPLADSRVLGSDSQARVGSAGSVRGGPASDFDRTV
jgi:hypothetical protein